MSWSLKLNGDACTVLINLQKMQSAVEMALDDLSNCGPDDPVVVSMEGYAAEDVVSFGINYNFSIAESGDDCEGCEDKDHCEERQQKLDKSKLN
jgi:hypothetical protein